jgi:hypothetical protein
MALRKSTHPNAVAGVDYRTAQQTTWVTAERDGTQIRITQGENGTSVTVFKGAQSITVGSDEFGMHVRVPRA